MMFWQLPPEKNKTKQSTTNQQQQKHPEALFIQTNKQELSGQ